jgi:DNA-directed RNA polymerase subunit H (RpoH/RPB5)
MLKVFDNVCMRNIAKFVSRRNLIYQENINKSAHLFCSKETGKTTILIMIDHPKVGVEILKSYLQTSFVEDVKNYIIIYKELITSTCSKIIQNFFNYSFELFTLTMFYYDITELHYYCHHEKVCDIEEQEKIKSIYQDKLPFILQTDIICKYFGFRKGDIIKIVRKNNDIYFRLVR